MTDKFEKWVKESAPEVPDSQLDEKVQRAILKERILDLQRRRSSSRRRVGVYAAVMVLVLVVSTQVVDVGSDGFDVELVKTTKKPTADGAETDIKIFESKFTGNRVGSHTGDPDEVRNTMEIAAGGVMAPHSVTRIAFAGGWSWTLYYYDEATKNWVSTSQVPGVEDKLNDTFLDFLTGESGRYLQLVEEKKATKSGSFLKAIDGIAYEFTKWEMLTPDSLVVEIWEGEPSH